MATFFVPGASLDERAMEDSYHAMRREIALELGHAPNSRRILSVWARRGATDCVTEVGCTDPLRGGTVVAIFDMGHLQPFVVFRRQDDDEHCTREILGAETYAVLEFDS